MHATNRCLWVLFALTACAAQSSRDTESRAAKLVADAECDERRIYVPCESTRDCGPEAQCSSPGADIASACFPMTGLGFDDTDVAQDDCPSIEPANTQKRFYNLYCVIECDGDADGEGEARRCPSQLPRCIDNPFSEASPHEAKRFCVP
jgi:hypothetical protein